MSFSQNLKSRMNMLLFVLAMGIPVTLGFALISSLEGKYISGAIFLAYTVVIIPILFFIIKYPHKIELLVQIVSTLIAFGPVYIMFFKINEVEHYAWLISYPIYFFVVSGFRWGIAWNLFIYLLFPLSYFYHPLLPEKPSIPFDLLFHYSLANIILFIISAYFARRVEAEHVTMQSYADSDQLTQIFNRRYASRILDEMCLRKQVGRQDVFSLILLDIDNFKMINDTYGHNAGDKILVEVTRVLKKEIRKNDIIARWGGEEFVIILDFASLDSAVLIAEKLRKKLMEHAYSHNLTVTASFGVATYYENMNTETLIHRADTMLYLSKNSGKNCVNYCANNSVHSSCLHCGDESRQLCYSCRPLPA